MSHRRPDAAPAVKPTEVSAELKSLMRRLKLGQLLDTLPERLALARSNRLPHRDFLEMLFADEVARRDRQSPAPSQSRTPGPADAAACLGRHRHSHLRLRTVGPS